MKKIPARKAAAAVLLIITVSSIPAQSNTVLDAFMERPKADWGTSAWLVYLAAGRLPENADAADAAMLFESSGHGTGDLSRPIRFGEFAYLAMENMDLPGGLMYRLFPSPRYAAKELKYRGWIPGAPKQNAELTPWEVTTALSEILAWQEVRQ